MSSEEEILKETIINLTQTFTSKDTESIHQAQQKLEILSQNLLVHIKILLKILSLPESQANPNLKTSAAIYLKNLVSSRANILSSQALLEILRTLITSILSNSQGTTNVENALMTAMFFIISSEIFSKDFNLIKEINDYLISTIQQANEANFIQIARSIIHIITSMVQSKSISVDKMEEHFNQIIPIIDDIFSKVQNYIGNVINTQFVDLLKYVFEMFYTFFLKLKQSKGMEKKMFIFFEKYGQFAYELLCFSSSNVLKQNVDCIIYFSNEYQLNKSMNSMKAKALQFLTFIVQSSGDILTAQTIIMLSSKVIEKILNSLDYCIKFEMNSIISEVSINGETAEFVHNGFNTILFNSLVFLTRALIREPIKNSFSQHLRNFLLNILFPLLVPPEEDVSRIQSEGEQYFLFFQDLLEEHKIKNYRIASSFLLKKLTSANIDLVLFVLSFVLQMLKFNLITDGNTNNVTLPENEFYLYLESKKNNHIITSYSAEGQISFALEILLIFSKKVIENLQFYKTLKKILVSYSSKLNSIESVLIKDKICKVYGVFLPEFFKSITITNEGFLSTNFSYLLFQIVQCDKNFPGLSFQATEAILSMIEDEKFSIVANKMVNQNFEKMVQLIEETECLLLFDLFARIISDIYIENQSLLLKFIENTVNRTKKEILSEKANKIDIIDKGLIILYSFLGEKNKPLNLEIINSFEMIIEPIVRYIKNPKKIIFEEEIIKLVTIFISSLNRLGRLSSILVPNLILVNDKNNRISTETFEFLITFFKTDKRVNECKETTMFLKNIIDLILKADTYEEEDDNTIKYAFLITSKLISLNLPMDISLLGQLLENSFKTYSKYLQKLNSNNQDISYEMIISTGISNLSLALLHYPNQTIEILITKNIFDSFFKSIQISYHFSFYSVIFGKILILGICSLIISNSKLLESLEKEKKIVILKLLLILINKQKKETSSNAKKLMKKEINCNFVQEEDQSDDDEPDDNDFPGGSKYKKKNDDFYDEELSDNEMIEEADIISEKTDEFEKFYSCLKSVSEFDKEVNDLFIQSLTNEEKKLLEEILHMRKIQVNYDNKIISIPRRTVKIKRTEK